MSIQNKTKDEKTPTGSDERGAPIFVCGHPRSGTTLLKSLLDGHSEILSFPEDTGYLAQIAKRPELTPENGLAWLLEESNCRKLGLRNDERWRDYSNFDFDAFQERARMEFCGGEQTHRRVFESIMTAYGQQIGQRGRKYWLEKTPGNENHLFLANQWFSDLRALYLVRDPRDVYASYKRKKEQEGETLSSENFVCRWGYSVWAWQQWAARNEGSFSLRYEDLVRYPRETLSIICQFLAVEYDEVLESPTLRENVWLGGSSYGNQFSEISIKSIGRWKEHLTTGESTLIEEYLGKVMLSLGYRLSVEPPSVTTIFSRLLHQREWKQILAVLLRLYWPFRLPFISDER